MKQILVLISEQCPSLMNPNSGQVTMETDGHTTTAYYICSDDYIIKGMTQSHLNVTCQTTGQWSAATPQCSKFICCVN